MSISFREPQGFSILEALLCITIFTLALVPIVSLFTSSHRMSHSARRLIDATAHAQSVLDTAAERGMGGMDALSEEGEKVLIHDESRADEEHPRRDVLACADMTVVPFSGLKRHLTARKSGGSVLYKIEVEWLSGTRQKVTLQKLAR